MSNCWKVLAILALTSCTTRYYVADVRHDGDKLVMTKCELDYRGMATHYCHRELVPDVR